MALPDQMRRWVGTGFDGLDSLKMEDVQLGSPGPGQIVVKMAAWSINFRDTGIITGMAKAYNAPNCPLEAPFIPLSDGSGTVAAVGAGVTDLHPGDSVVSIINPAWKSGAFKREYGDSNIAGEHRPGLLCEYVVADRECWTRKPDNLSFAEASTLTTSALAGWQAVFGDPAHAPGPGRSVLIEGTGGVSIFAAQFAKAAGALVIAITSSDKKAAYLKSLGVDHVLNRYDKGWPSKARELTFGKEGIDLVVEVAGGDTQREAMKVVKPSGMMSLVGFVSTAIAAEKKDPTPTSMEVYLQAVTTRSIRTGSTEDYVRMVYTIEQHGIKPQVAKTFTFDEVPAAYQYLMSQKFVGKVCITV